jgi:hypothetical protein
VTRAGVPLGKSAKLKISPMACRSSLSDASNYMTGAERRHDGRHETSLELRLMGRTAGPRGACKCEFSGNSHKNITMGNSAKLALRRN